VAQALGGFGWIEGKNILIDYRFAAGDPTPYKAMQQNGGLGTRRNSGQPRTGGRGVRQQARTMPIGFVLLPDPVGLGFVRSLPRPGGNLTGFTALTTQRGWENGFDC
jgi:putative ABC transport system substrate-binding protein